MARLWLVLGALSGGVAVGLSAWAAHGLAPEQAALAASALTMQGWHALALLAVGLLAERRGGWAVHLAGGGFVLGALCFCGAVWWRALTGGSLGGVAPFGGTLLMLAWLMLALAAGRRA
ncbi:DUF423 domain-containing protein [Roseomonas marmotae]|uniref:DUF423 domain-containing protein n=1 Tax=Roseomonas marmotae TaxID=2768161 RepID=A0ABS3KGV9_9PROT|nr:DUF423 domain-containing protein [Roseomonas marmotae]MBO1076705.1 DUF423 domain-containing protein [Roseomonas marmotae]QTI79834.1 DUF423 domain-containing protein [Roseomonas marmotae]